MTDGTIAVKRARAAVTSRTIVASKPKYSAIQPQTPAIIRSFDFVSFFIIIPLSNRHVTIGSSDLQAIWRGIVLSKRTAIVIGLIE